MSKIFILKENLEDKPNPKRKYTKGGRLDSLEGLVHWLGLGKHIYVRDKLLYNDWVMNWELRYAKNKVEEGFVCMAYDVERLEEGKTKGKKHNWLYEK